jgi:hypothetical protein
MGGHQEAGDPLGRAVLAAGAGEQGAVGGGVHAGGPHLLAVDPPAALAVVLLADGPGLHEGGVRTVVGLGQAEGRAEGVAVQHVGDQVLLVGPAEVADHQHERIVADDRVLVLQVVEQAQALGRQVLADHRHPEVGAVLAAVFAGRAKR